MHLCRCAQSTGCQRLSFLETIELRRGETTLSDSVANLSLYLFLLWQLLGSLSYAPIGHRQLAVACASQLRVATATIFLNVTLDLFLCYESDDRISYMTTRPEVTICGSQRASRVVSFELY